MNRLIMMPIGIIACGISAMISAAETLEVVRVDSADVLVSLPSADSFAGEVTATDSEFSSGAVYAIGSAFSHADDGNSEASTLVQAVAEISTAPGNTSAAPFASAAGQDLVGGLGPLWACLWENGSQASGAFEVLPHPTDPSIAGGLMKGLMSFNLINTTGQVGGSCSTEVHLQAGSFLVSVGAGPFIGHIEFSFGGEVVLEEDFEPPISRVYYVEEPVGVGSSLQLSATRSHDTGSLTGPGGAEAGVESTALASFEVEAGTSGGGIPNVPARIYKRVTNPDGSTTDVLLWEQEW